MRNAFAQKLVALAGEDERIVCLSGDIGNRMFDDYKGRFPQRFFNCGVAEANMMSMAAGMALCGLRPVVYTIVPFVTTRCLEQIRVDVCYHNLGVVIVGVGGGLCYAELGATHHSCEDIALLRVLPQMTVLCPGDACEVRLALEAATRHDGPVYIRLGKKGEPVAHRQTPQFVIGKGITLRRGADVALLSTGNMLSAVLEAAEILAQRNVAARVVSMHTVKPLDTELLDEVFSKCTTVATVEEHSRLGGLGGAVAEWLADQPRPRARLLRIGTADTFLHASGNQSRARRHFGLDAKAVSQQVLDMHLAILSSGSGK